MAFSRSSRSSLAQLASRWRISSYLKVRPQCLDRIGFGKAPAVEQLEASGFVLASMVLVDETLNELDVCTPEQSHSCSFDVCFGSLTQQPFDPGSVALGVAHLARMNFSGTVQKTSKTSAPDTVIVLLQNIVGSTKCITRNGSGLAM